MATRRGPVLDDTLGLALGGYAWLPALWRHGGGRAVRTRVMGQPAVALRGPDAVRFFYDERHVRRHGAIPEPVRATLFGRRAVHTLDGADHRHRKVMFRSVLTDPRRVAALVDQVAAAWHEAVAAAGDGRRIVLFDEASRVLTTGVCAWAGIPLTGADVAPLARDLVALVDGFATPGPRHWRARRARGRRERWLAALIGQVRAGTVTAMPGSALEVVAAYRGRDGHLMDAELAAVELLNIIRPTVAVSWFVAFTAHALHRWPEQRDRLRTGDAAYAVAFAHEVRRFYPFAPFVGGRAVTDLTWQGQHVRAGSLVLLDIYGQNHDATLWPDPYRFDPGRFVGRAPDPYELIPQGGADARTGHRCPGEDVTVALLAAFAGRLARLDYTVPGQDLTISLRRIPALPRSRVVLTDVHRQTPAVEPAVRRGV
ncbi:cytochrome P450 [Micromonospora terminaliae]|uniref:Cytochrome P450 n=1 Tax=Micromonospora terminaliae TaxID=1914461 RepID=A0AAJ3DKJ0_9ACTN|nr:cytochrome P450 [Micromonospora terminaliae]NES27125.1 cytochrome P450 [Micromonospora terminaliae]QGL48110.1 cytochrome P450 [Micromonospora terminaliae]